MNKNPSRLPSIAENKSLEEHNDVINMSIMEANGYMESKFVMTTRCSLEIQRYRGETMLSSADLAVVTSGKGQLEYRPGGTL
jgi:hypothetical protein